MKRIALGTIVLCVVLDVANADVGLIGLRERPIVWGSASIQLYVSPLDFGPGRPVDRIPNSDVRNAVEAALGVWRSTATATLPPIVLKAGDDGNKLILDQRSDVDALQRSTNPAIFVVYDRFDVTGLARKSESGSRVLAATYTARTGSSLSAAVITVTRYGAENVEIIRNALVHEFGHALGLGHASVYHTSELASGWYRSHVDTMFPFATTFALHPNSAAWLSYLYRSSSNVNPAYAIVRGTLRDTRGNQRISGVNIVATAIDDSSGSRRFSDTTRFSCISGYSDVKGAFLLPVLPGRYQVTVESVPERSEVPDLPTFYGPKGLILGPDILRPDNRLYRVQPTLGIHQQAVQVLINGRSQDDIQLSAGQELRAEIRLTQ